MAKKKAESNLECVTRKITLTGLVDIMFDRYAGDNKTELRTEDKFYFDRDGMSLVLPAANVVSLLTAQNTPSAPKRFMDSRKYKSAAQAILSYTIIQPQVIPFTRNGKPIKFHGFEGEEDPKSGCYIHRAVARLDKGIPNPKVRPCIPVPWYLAFELTYYHNSEVQEDTIRNLLIKGGLAIGLGTFRGVYGKFSVSAWD